LPPTWDSRTPLGPSPHHIPAAICDATARYVACPRRIALAVQAPMTTAEFADGVDGQRFSSLASTTAWSHSQVASFAALGRHAQARASARAIPISSGHGTSGQVPPPHPYRHTATPYVYLTARQVLIQETNWGVVDEFCGTSRTNTCTKPQVSTRAGTRQYDREGSLNPQVLGSSPVGSARRALVRTLTKAFYVFRPEGTEG
jgi:hypothetical protein